MPSGRRRIAEWVAANQESGLTLLRISPRTVRPIKAASERPALGSPVVVIGDPFGLGHTVSRGHIAGLDRALKLRSRDIGGLIQVQAPLYPGDSGAVVANLRGQLLGLIRSGMAIPVAANDRPRTASETTTSASQSPLTMRSGWPISFAPTAMSIVPISASGWNRPTNQRANHRRRCRRRRFLSGLSRPGRDGRTNRISPRAWKGPICTR